MIIVLLPAYNEEESLPRLMPRLKATLDTINQEYWIVVCNDGSNDRTAELLENYAEEMPIEVIHHKINRGLGETSRDLFERAAELSKENDLIIRLDCDFTHEPELIPALIDKINQGFDVVVASRFETGGGQIGVSPYRAFISRAANVFMKVFFSVPGLKEYTSGFRAYRADKIKQAIDFFGNDFIQLKGLGFTCTLEKLVKLKILDAKFAEVPFVLRYDQKWSESKMVSSVTTYGYFTMGLLYYWPWGGWRRGYRARLKKIKAAPQFSPID